MKTSIRIATGFIGAAFMLSACGSSYDRAEYLTELQDAGMTEEAATCMVDALEIEIGEDKLGGSASGLTDEDEAIMEEIAIDCVLGG